MSVAFGGAAADLKAQQGDQVGYWTLDPGTGTYAFTPQDPAAAALVPQSFMQLTDAAPASSSMNLLPLAALVGGAFLALSRLGPRRNPFRAYPGPPPSHALFGRLVGRFWWGADPPPEVVAAREARKHHKRGESLEHQIDAELAHGRELRKQLDEHRDQVPNLRDYGLDKRDEFERDVAAHNREQQRLNDEYQESGRKRYALIARHQEQKPAEPKPPAAWSSVAGEGASVEAAAEGSMERTRRWLEREYPHRPGTSPETVLADTSEVAALAHSTARFSQTPIQRAEQIMHVGPGVSPWSGALEAARSKRETGVSYLGPAARPGELFAVPAGHRQRFEVVRHPENYGRATWSIVDRQRNDQVVGEGILFAAQANATAAELNSGRKADSTEGAMRGREGRSLVTPELAEAIRQGDDAKRDELEHVADLRQELRTLETLAPKMSEGAISPTQMNRMSTRQRNRYDKNMARRFQVEDELKELEKPPEQREAERKARETKTAEKARSDRLAQVESEIRFRESVHHRGIGASAKRNKEIYAELLAERERLGGEPAPKAPELESPVASIEAKARSGMSNRVIVAAMKREGSPVELNAVNGIVANMRAAEKSPEQRAAELAESAARGRAEWEEQQAGFRRLRELEQSKREFTRKPAEAGAASPGPHAPGVRPGIRSASDEALTSRRQFLESDAALGTPAERGELHQIEQEQKARHAETPAEWRARMERRQEEKRAATPAELKERTAWVPYLDSEAPGVRRTGPSYEEMGDVEHRDSLASSLDWASRVKWGAMRLELGKAGYKSKEAEDELAEFRKRAGELGYRIEHAHYGAGDRTWRFRVEKGALPPGTTTRPTPADSAAKRQYEAGWKASERFGSSEGTGPTPLERADDRGAPPAWYHGYEDHASDRQKWATFENRSGEVVHLPRSNPPRRWPRFPGRRWRRVA